METCEGEEERKPRLTLEEKEVILKRKIEKIRIDEAIRKAQETRGRTSFPPIYLPESVPKDFFRDENEKSPKSEFDEWLDSQGGSAPLEDILAKIKQIEDERK